MDPLELFRQAAPNGIVNKEIRKPAPGKDLASQLDDPIEEPEVFVDAVSGDDAHQQSGNIDREHLDPKIYGQSTSTGRSSSTSHSTGKNENTLRLIDDLSKGLAALKAEVSGQASSPASPSSNSSWIKLNQSSDNGAVTSSGNSTAEKIEAQASAADVPGNAIAVPADSQETTITHEEMSRITPAECPFLMNKE
jgi:hypothetical protein